MNAQCPMKETYVESINHAIASLTNVVLFLVSRGRKYLN
jgi:hypothetical protein